MRSPHTIEIQFVFNNVAIAGPLISQMSEADALADKTSSAWVAFARTSATTFGSPPGKDRFCNAAPDPFTKGGGFEATRDETTRPSSPSACRSY
jgi:hypothetical protein